MDNSIAIMQPYLFPYLGYFQLVKAVDTFVFYDDVNYIKKGWINRNNILINGKASLFTVPVLSASQNKLINEIQVGFDEKWKVHFFKTLDYNYKKAPFYKETITLADKVFSYSDLSIADLAIKSIVLVSQYLNIETVFEKSSIVYGSTKGMDKAERLIEITKKKGAKNYVNPMGGKELYDKECFRNQDVNLFFMENKITSYTQFEKEFVNGLSIIDVLMFNSPAEILVLLNNFKTI